MEWLDQIILGLANIFVWVVCSFFLYVCISEANFHLFQVTLGNNEPLYQALKDLVVLMATFFAGYKNTVMEMIAGIFVLRQKQYHPLQTQHENRPEWIRDDALNGPEWQKVKRYATLAMGMYYWPSYLFLSPRGPLVCIRKLDNDRENFAKGQIPSILDLPRDILQDIPLRTSSYFFILFIKV
jgi:hypothetical protein